MVQLLRGGLVTNMYGHPIVKTNLPAQGVKPITFNCIGRASRGQRKEDQAFICQLWASHHMAIVEELCRCMGDRPDVRGGTMGEPNIDIPDYVEDLNEALLNTFSAAAAIASPWDLACPGPWSRREKCRKILVTYLHNMCDFHD